MRIVTEFRHQVSDTDSLKRPNAASNIMSEILQARVDWKRFGYHHPGLLGERFEDSGERLAIITCPWCGNPRSAEYAEYMQMLRYPSMTCGACKGGFTLRWSQQPRDETKGPSPGDERTAAPPTGERDMFGRRDWGTV